MSDLGNREVLAKNLKYYMSINNVDRNQLCKSLGFKYTTLTDWINANKYPRIDKIEMMANYFGIQKSDLIESKENNDDGIYIQKADGTTVFLKNASETDKALMELPEEQKKAILSLIGKRMDEIDKQLGDE